MSADNQYADPNDAPHETRRLQAIKVESNAGAGWQLIRQYTLDQDYSLTPDSMGCSPTCIPINTTYRRLTLKSITRVANDGTTALPTTTFGYGEFSFVNSHDSNWFGGAWNRLTTVDNGQGGTIAFTYENVGEQANNGLMHN